MPNFFETGQFKAAVSNPTVTGRRSNSNPVTSVAGVLPIALGSESSRAVNWFQAQFAGRLVQKELCPF